MKKVLVFAIATHLLLISCNKESNPNCGANNTFEIFLLGNSITDSATGYYYSYKEGSTSVFQWSGLVSDVCPEEHVKVQFRVTLKDPSYADKLSVRARVSYGIFSERSFPMTLVGEEYIGNGEVGLKQAYGTDPAEFIPILEVLFLTKENYLADKTFLKQHVLDAWVEAKYLNYQY